jgi:signal transduction histidine kinase
VTASALGQKLSLRLRLAIAGAVSLIFALLIAFFGLSLIFERHVERRVAAELALHLDQLIAALTLKDGKLALDRQPADPRFTQPLSGLYWQVMSGDEVLRSRSLWDAELELPPLDPGAPVSRTIPGPQQTSLLTIEREVVGGKRLGNRTVLLAVAVIRRDIEVATSAFRREMLPYLMLLALLFVAATVLQITIGLRPLGALRDKVADIRQGRASRIGDGFPVEVLSLTRELDELVASREEQIRRAREHAADFAHGLKTPLQAMAGDIRRLRERGEIDLADRIQSLATVMRRHVDHQLARARMAGRPTGNADARAVIEGVVAVLARTPQGELLNWELDVPGEIRARIDAEDLTEVVGSVLENAMRYARQSVVVRAAIIAGDATIEIVDDGPGIPADKIDYVLGRGRRLDESSGGAGLGLAIANDIVTAAGGTLSIQNGEVGLRVVIRLSGEDLRPRLF